MQGFMILAIIGTEKDTLVCYSTFEAVIKREIGWEKGEKKGGRRE